MSSFLQDMKKTLALNFDKSTSGASGASGTSGTSGKVNLTKLTPPSLKGRPGQMNG